MAYARGMGIQNFPFRVDSLIKIKKKIVDSDSKTKTRSRAFLFYFAPAYAGWVIRITSVLFYTLMKVTRNELKRRVQSWILIPEVTLGGAHFYFTLHRHVQDGSAGIRSLPCSFLNPHHRKELKMFEETACTLVDSGSSFK